MSYTDLKTVGKIVKIDPLNIVDRISEPDLISPEQLYLTRIEIAEESSSQSTEVYCAIPQEYLNKEVTLIQHYFKDSDMDVKVFVQQLYLGDKLVMNQSLVKKF